MIASDLITLLTQAKDAHGDLPVVAWIGNYGNSLDEITELNLDRSDEFPNGCIELL
jgi:hypothetical protein